MVVSKLCVSTGTLWFMNSERMLHSLAVVSFAKSDYSFGVLSLVLLFRRFELLRLERLRMKQNDTATGLEVISSADGS
jgi:hypothetical protein